jgi:hypothetical protein
LARNIRSLNEKRLAWSTPLPRPIVTPGVMKLKTLADVRKLIGHIPKERRQLSTWQHVETHLTAAAKGADVRDASVALMIVLQLEGVPYSVR